MLYNLAVHYRHSETVIGVQLGNEEGFSFLDESDFNPVTASLYEEWKIKTNKTDYAQFKKEAINWWWKQFTSAYHEGDPYKILSFNLDAGQSEAEDPERTEVSGTSSATYNDGNLDAIGTMFYKNWGNKAWLGLDKYYNEGRYNYELPILIPSEIGIGRFNSPHNFNNFVVNSLERGAQGFGVYCYGEVRKELPDSISARKYLTDMFSSIEKNESIIYAGLPGPGYVCGNIVESPLKVSHLNVDNKETLIMIYNPNDNAEPITPKNEDLSLRLNSNENGKYKVNVCKNGATILTKTISLDKDKENLLLIPEVSVDDILFISVTK